MPPALPVRGTFPRKKRDKDDSVLVPFLFDAIPAAKEMAGHSRHFPQSEQPLQISRLPQWSQFLR